MNDEVAARVHALIAQWRKQAVDLDAMFLRPQAQLCRNHAAALDAALAAALAPTSEKGVNREAQDE